MKLIVYFVIFGVIAIFVNIVTYVVIVIGVGDGISVDISACCCCCNWYSIVAVIAVVVVAMFLVKMLLLSCCFCNYLQTRINEELFNFVCNFKS